MRIFVAMAQGFVRDTFFPPDNVSRLESLGEVHWFKGKEQISPKDLSQGINEAEVLVTGWGTPMVDAEMLDRAPNLRIVAHTGGSVASIVSAAAFDRGVRVLSGNKVFAQSVAEAVLAYSLCMLRDLRKYSIQARETGWRAEDWKTEGLFGKKVGLLGFGAVAREVVRLMQPFSPDISIWADHVTQQEADSLRIRKTSLEEVMATSDIISIHLALTAETYHLLDREKLSMIRENALLINTARGSIVKEEDLTTLLESGRFRAALDVFEQEPLPKDHPLLRLPNVLVIPHMAGPTTDRRAIAASALMDDLERIGANQQTQHEITRDMARWMTLSSQSIVQRLRKEE